MIEGQQIVCFASASYEARSRVNVHHIMNRLAAANTILYVESPGLRSFHLASGVDFPRLAARFRRWLGGLSQPQPHLYVLSAAGIPFFRRGVVERWNQRLFARQVRRAAHHLAFDRPIAWSFLPTLADAALALNPRLIIYHCVDDLAGNPGVNARAIEEQERRLVAAADLCFAISRPLAARLAAMGAKVVCVPNVAEVERFFSSPRRLPPELAPLPRPLIGYVGNVASYMVDIELLAELADRRPAWSFVLVGQVGGGDPSTSVKALRQRRNIHLLGPRPYADVPDYVHGLDVCLIPFRRNRVTESALPLKTLEYLAAGKPVVSTPLAGLTAEPLGDVIAYAEGVEGFARAIEHALGAVGQELAAARRQVAARYSWERRFPEISNHVSALLARKASGPADAGRARVMTGQRPMRGMR